MAAPETPQTSTLRHAFGNVLSFFILLLIGVLAFSICFFSVIKYGSVILEFDPYFNYRVTQRERILKGKLETYVVSSPAQKKKHMWCHFQQLLKQVSSWTCYWGNCLPGTHIDCWNLMEDIEPLNIPLSVETVSVFTAPIFSAFASWATYLLTKVASYISRSVAGSYDNEAALNTWSLFSATLNTIAYFYMVCAWGVYTFIINLIPMHVLLCMVCAWGGYTFIINLIPMHVLLCIVTGHYYTLLMPHFALAIIGYLGVRSTFIKYTLWTMQWKNY